jgi:hypothetical protein
MQLLYPLLKIVDDLLVLLMQEDIGLDLAGNLWFLRLKVLLILKDLFNVGLLEMMLYVFKFIVPFLLEIVLQLLCGGFLTGQLGL